MFDSSYNNENKSNNNGDSLIPIKISHLSVDEYGESEIEALLKLEGLDQRFRLSYKHERKSGSTCQVYYAHDLWQSDQRLVALKIIRADFIDSFVSHDDLLNLQKSKDCFYKPKNVIYNRRLKDFKNYVPIEQYIGELARICPHLPIARCVENGAKLLETFNGYLIAFEYVPGRTVWENLVRTDFTYLNESQARTFVRLFIEQLLILLKHHIIHCDLNTCQNYYYRPYDEIDPRKETCEQWSLSEDGEDGYSSLSGDSRHSSMDELVLESPLSPLKFIDFDWALCTADPDDDRHEILLKTIQNLFERTPRIVQLFCGNYYWDFRRAVESRKYGLKELLNHPWLAIDDR